MKCLTKVMREEILMEEYQTLEEELEVPDGLTQVFRRMVSPEESQILVLITEDFHTAATLAAKVKKNPKKVTIILEALYRRGFLEKRRINSKEAYRCKSFYDIIKTHLQEGRHEALGHENLRTLREYYITTRIKKTEETIKGGQLEYTSRVIAIGKAVPTTQHVLPTQQAIEHLKKAELCALTRCGCRVAFGNCDNPLDTCLILDEEAEHLIARGLAKEITLEEAERTLEIADKAGLVHLTLYLPGQRVYAVCSCCPCCCHELQALLNYGKTFFVAESDYTAVCDTDQCNGCGECTRRCIFGAREMRNGKSFVREENCYGCGLCVTTCPTKATRLIPRK